MSQKNVNKQNKKAVDNTLTLKQQKKIADEFQRLIQFLTIDNPQRILARQKEYMDAIVKRVETHWDKITDKFEEDDDVNEITGDVIELIDDYRANIEGIEMWWKYSHIEV